MLAGSSLSVPAGSAHLPAVAEIGREWEDHATVSLTLLPVMLTPCSPWHLLCLQDTE